MVCIKKCLSVKKFWSFPITSCSHEKGYQTLPVYSHSGGNSVGMQQSVLILLCLSPRVYYHCAVIERGLCHLQYKRPWNEASVTRSTNNMEKDSPHFSYCKWKQLRLRLGLPFCLPPLPTYQHWCYFQNSLQWMYWWWLVDCSASCGPQTSHEHQSRTSGMGLHVSLAGKWTELVKKDIHIITSAANMTYTVLTLNSLLYWNREIVMIKPRRQLWHPGGYVTPILWSHFSKYS